MKNLNLGGGGGGGGAQQKMSVTFFNAYMYILFSSPTLQPQLGPEAFEIPNDMVHVSNSNYKYNVALVKKIFTPKFYQ